MFETCDSFISVFDTNFISKFDLFQWNFQPSASNAISLVKFCKEFFGEERGHGQIAANALMITKCCWCRFFWNFNATNITVCVLCEAVECVDSLGHAECVKKFPSICMTRDKECAWTCGWVCRCKTELSMCSSTFHDSTQPNEAI